jgi:hypothetical protein
MAPRAIAESAITLIDFHVADCKPQTLNIDYADRADGVTAQFWGIYTHFSIFQLMVPATYLRWPLCFQNRINLEA